jgi:hypothetical protein
LKGQVLGDIILLTLKTTRSSLGEKMRPGSNHFLWKMQSGLISLVLVLSTLGAVNPPPDVIGQTSTSRRVPLATTQTSGIQKFDLLLNLDGWVLMDNHLYWTSDEGASWSDITPPVPSNSRIYDVNFIDSESGWVLWNESNGDGSQTLSISHTSDQGRNWIDTSVRTFTVYDPDANLETASIFWLDANTGWISIKRESSSNVSIGSLFRSDDGGNTWMQLSLPVGDPVYFATREIGWVAGGAGGDEFYSSRDGGNTWKPQILTAPSGMIVQNPFYFLPTFENSNTGTLPVLVNGGNESQLEFYASGDGGQSWELALSVPLGNEFDPGNYIPLDVIDQNHTIIILRGSNLILQVSGQQITTLENTNNLSADIEKIDMVTPEKGWAQSTTRNCVRIPDPLADPGAKGSFNCVIDLRLLQTVNSGQTWEPILLPGVGTTSLQQNIDYINHLDLNSISMLSNEIRISTAGFDSCVPATISQMQDWWNNSPYYVWNLYTGGANRGCNAANQAALTASFISQLRGQGWYFIPTWVGLQAYCSTGNFYKMSSNTTTAFNQGVTEANSASDAVASLGFTGSIIYFDLEAFNMADTVCVNAARSFISGWTYQLRNRGNLAGLYAMAYEIINYATISNVPDGVWMAGGGTNYASYNPAATVWGNRYVSDSLWYDTQRIYQYTTGHYETHGSTSMNIDSDVINGIVAIPGIVSHCPGPSLVSPADGFASPSQTINFGWSAPVGCTFNGYTFRIKDIANMDTGGNTIIDSSTSLMSRTETIASQWNNRDLYWGVRTNFPFSPNWSVRRFRIESSPGCSLTANQVALFSSPNYGGTCVIKNVGEYPNAASIGVNNDDISSVMVGTNVRLILCRDVDYLGGCETFSGDDPNLTDNSIGDNQASSAKVETRLISATLYTDANYGGTFCQLEGASWMNTCAGMDNLASSFKVLAGWSARVWTDSNLSGASRCMSGDTPNLSGLFFNENGSSSLNDSISSFAAYNQAACPPLLSVVKAGNGSGTVTSSPVGIDCGTICAASIADNTVVTLTATASTGSTFTGWSGSGCSGSGTCIVTMDIAKSVTATFTLNGYVLTILKTGSGTITSSPVGLNCGPTCSYSFNYNTVVTLITAATPGSSFSSWGGDCTGTGTCKVTMSSAKSVNAIFVYDINTLSVAKSGNGSGTVTSSPAGINCGSTCSAPFSYPTTVKLTATPAAGSIFTGWSGYCTGTGVCQVPMTATRSVTATFLLNTYLYYLPLIIR